MNLMLIPCVRMCEIQNSMRSFHRDTFTRKLKYVSYQLPSHRSQVISSDDGKKRKRGPAVSTYLHGAFARCMKRMPPPGAGTYLVFFEKKLKLVQRKTLVRPSPSPGERARYVPHSLSLRPKYLGKANTDKCVDLFIPLAFFFFEVT